MAKEIVKQEKNEVSIVPMTGWGVQAKPEHLIIPRILLMQGGSKFVKKTKQASAGDFVDNITVEKLGDEKNPPQLIFLSYTDNYIIETKDNSEFVRTEEININNALADYEFQEEGRLLKRRHAFNFFVLAANKDIETEIPYCLTIKSSGTYPSAKAKNLITYFEKLTKVNKPSASKVIEVGVEEKVNDKGQDWLIMVPKVPGLRDSTETELKVAYDWYQKLNRAPVKVHEEDIEVADDEEVFI